MDKDRKKELVEQYKNRHPQMGVVCWKSGDNIWAAVSKDTRSDYNGTSFQLKLGSWPNKEMQKIYNDSPESFEWIVARELDYEDYNEDHTEDLEILMMDFLEENPTAMPMKQGGKLR